MTMAKGALQLSLSSLILFPWVFCVQMCESHHLDVLLMLSLWFLFSACFALVWSVCFCIIIAIIIIIGLLGFFLMGEIKKGCGFGWGSRGGSGRR